MRNRICYKLGFSKKCKENTDYLKLNVPAVLIKSCMNMNGQMGNREKSKKNIFLEHRNRCSLVKFFIYGN